jgi:hypothetical protein
MQSILIGSEVQVVVVVVPAVIRLDLQRRLGLATNEANQPHNVVTTFKSNRTSASWKPSRVAKRRLAIRPKASVVHVMDRVQ